MFSDLTKTAKNNRVIFSSDAFNTIVCETIDKHPVETGGILLGQIRGNTWYVIECIEPGSGSIFKPHYFEYDHKFVNYLANTRSKRYHSPLKLLGLWHRHPGSFDQFSKTDDETNLEFARRNEAGAISGLVNIDPEFRFTLYHFDTSLIYRKTDFEINDDLIPDEFMKKKFLNFGDTEIKVEIPVEEPHIPPEVLDILIAENEILEKQNTYNCEFSILNENSLIYKCQLIQKSRKKQLPEKIEWIFDFEKSSIAFNKQLKPYKKGAFIQIINEITGESASPQTKKKKTGKKISDE